MLFFKRPKASKVFRRSASFSWDRRDEGVEVVACEDCEEECRIAHCAAGVRFRKADKHDLQMKFSTISDFGGMVFGFRLGLVYVVAFTWKRKRRNAALKMESFNLFFSIFHSFFS